MPPPLPQCFEISFTLKDIPQNDQRGEAVILSQICWGMEPPPPPLPRSGRKVGVSRPLAHCPGPPVPDICQQCIMSCLLPTTCILYLRCITARPLLLPVIITTSFLLSHDVHDELAPIQSASQASPPLNTVCTWESRAFVAGGKQCYFPCFKHIWGPNPCPDQLRYSSHA